MKLEIINVTKGYEKDVLKNLNMIITDNLVRIDGHNGCGKSTLFKVLSGKLDYTGKIVIDDKLVNSNILSNYSVLVNQDINLFYKKTVNQNIKYIAHVKNDPLIEKFGFNDKLKMKAKNLSGGWQKKLMLLLAFLIKPKILLLDEYANYLDQSFVKMINKEIIDYSKDHLVLYIDHADSINAKVINLETIDEKTEDKDFEIQKENKKIKPIFNRFDIVSVIFFAVVLSLFVAAFSIANFSNEYLVAKYYASNDLNFLILDDGYQDVDTTYAKYYCDSSAELNDDKHNEIYTIYTEEMSMPLIEESDNNYDNSCYVFSNNEDLFEQYITLDDSEYYVSGVIDQDVDLYDEDYQSYFNSVVIVDSTMALTIASKVKASEDGTANVPSGSASFAFTFAYLTKEETKTFIENDYAQVDSLGMWSVEYTDFDSDTLSFNSICYILALINIIFMAAFIFNSIHTKKNQLKVYSSFSRSYQEIYISNIIEFIIISIGMFILTGILSYIEIIKFYYYCDSIYIYSIFPKMLFAYIFGIVQIILFAVFFNLFIKTKVKKFALQE